jgi:hypothetical protein
VPVKDDAVGDCIRDDGLESSIGEFDAPLISRVRLEVEALKDGVPGLELFVDVEMLPEVTSLLCIAKAFSFPPPTAPRNRLYSPLSPFCIISPAIPFGSTPDEDTGGEANSLKVVRVSD